MTRLPSHGPSRRWPSPSTIAGWTPKNGRVAEPGLSRDRAGQRRDQDAAGLGLPPGVDDRAAPLADHVVVPEPGLGIDRLADRAEQLQALARGLLDRIVAVPHQGADRGRRGVDDLHLVLVDDLPEARDGRVVRHALEHQRDRAVGERAIDDVAVAGDPADVGGAPVDVAVVVVEHVLVGQRDVDQIAAGGVQHALGLAGRARGVEDEQRVLGVHRLGRAVRRSFGHHPIGVVIAALVERDVGLGVAEHQDLDVGRAPLERFVGIALERDVAPAALAAIGGDHELAGAVVDPVGQAVGREAAEHHRVDGADPRAGEHGEGGLGDHRHVDRDPVALLDAQALQDVGEPADLLVQLAVGDLAVDLRVVALPEDRGLIAAGREMAIDTVVGDVQDAVLVPADARVVPEVDVLDPARRLDPVDPLACSAQKPSGSSIERWYMARYLASSQWADLANASGTGKTSTWDMTSSDLRSDCTRPRPSDTACGRAQP